MLRIDNIDIKGKRVLIRTDFNVPINNGKIKSDFRIIKTLDTIKYCLNNNAKIILMSHLGRPKGPDSSLSLFPALEFNLANICCETIFASPAIPTVTFFVKPILSGFIST